MEGLRLGGADGTRGAGVVIERARGGCTLDSETERLRAAATEAALDCDTEAALWGTERAWDTGREEEGTAEEGMKGNVRKMRGGGDWSSNATTTMRACGQGKSNATASIMVVRRGKETLLG